MVEHYDWWEHVPNAKSMLDDIAGAIIDKQKSVALILPSNTPWLDEMHEKLENMLNDSQKTFETYDCPEDVQPGKFILKKYFFDDISHNLNPNHGYATLIAKYDESSRIKNTRLLITTKSVKQFNEWVDFVISYEKEKGDSSLRCQFIVEYCGDASPNHVSSLCMVKWAEYIHDYDMHIYSLLSVSQKKGSKAVLEYLADFISLICENNVELVSMLAGRGVDCIEDPKKVFGELAPSASESVKNILNKFYNDDRQLEAVLWRAQINSVFPLIEEFKNKLITDNEQAFDGDFKYKTVYGKEKTDYHDLEIGEILRLHDKGKLKLDQDVFDKARTFKKGRDYLAHFKPIPFEELVEIIDK